MSLILQSAGISPDVAERFVAILRWVEASETVDQAADVADKSRQIADWLRVQQASDAARVAATRLECIAVRRVAQLGGVDRLRPIDRRAALSFAALSDEEFKVVLDAAPIIGRPNSIFQHLRNKQEEAIREEITGRRVKRVVVDGFPEDPDPVEGRARIARAAAELLDGLSLKGCPFTVDSAGRELGERLAEETEDRWWSSDELRPALREAIREAIRLAPPSSDDDSGPRPDIVTYYDNQIGWVRIPWHVASIAQLGAMVELRQQQAKAMQSAADQLASLYVGLLNSADGDMGVKCPDALFPKTHRKKSA